MNVVWFKNDLRLSDNPALASAAKNGEIVCLYIWSPEELGDCSPGSASKWWLHHSLVSLRESLKRSGVDLFVLRGKSADLVPNVAEALSAESVFWNRQYEPLARATESRIAASLARDGRAAKTFQSALLAEPAEFKNAQGKPYQVYTPFWNALSRNFSPPPEIKRPKLVATSDSVRKIAAKFRPCSVEDLELLPKIQWYVNFSAIWHPGEAAAAKALKDFSSSSVGDYENLRNIPSSRGTSMLSPHLHFGEISPAQIWRRIKESSTKGKSSETYLKEIVWREFAHHLLFHFPDTPHKPLRAKFERFPWKKSKALLSAWQRGQTGYPIVDAGMRQLWKTGWMHNRVRMIVASFLVKDLMIPWQEGAAWFWDTLVDADLANNTLGWQWTAGCGADAAPYFRIFNPESQGQKFDPDGDYVREFVPELSQIPPRWIHRPSAAPASILSAAGVTIGKDYPTPIVDHGEARAEALAAFARLA